MGAAQKLKVLLVDDEPLVRQNCSYLFRSVGIETLEASNADEGLEILAREKISLVVSDIQMPGNENLAFLREMGRLYPGLPVVLLTAYPTLDTAIQSFGLAVAYLVKPPTAQQLLETVQQALGHYEARQAVTRSISRVKTWLTDLEQLSAAMSHPRDATGQNSTNAYLELSLQNLSVSLHELRDVVAVLAGTPGGANSLRSHELARAVKETISVLEETKHTFKSKQLGELRKRLETLITTTEGEV